MMDNNFAESIEHLQCQYLCGKPIKLIDWKNILHNITWDDQFKLLESTLNAPITKNCNLSTTYRIGFLRFIIDFLESHAIEVHDGIYEMYVSLLNDKSNVRPKYSYKHYTIPKFKQTVSIKESAHMITDGTTGLHCWQAAAALAEWAIHNPERFRHKTILELGAGTGLTGFVISKICQPKQVVLTDGNSLVTRLLRENLEVNFDGAGNRECSVAIEDLDWNCVRDTDLLDRIIPDVVIAADVVYDDSIFLPLCETLDCIFTKCRNRCTLILTCTVRNENTLVSFLELLDSSNFTRAEEQIISPTHLYWDNSTPIRIYSITRQCV